MKKKKKDKIRIDIDMPGDLYEMLEIAWKHSNISITFEQYVAGIIIESIEDLRVKLNKL